MKWPLPVSKRWSSRRLTGWPAPNRRLPGRMFIALFLGILSGRQCSRQARNRPSPYLPSFRGASATSEPGIYAAEGMLGAMDSGLSPDGLLRNDEEGSDDGVRLPHLAQHRLDRLALFGRQGFLGWDGIADIVTLDRKRGLDEGGEIVACEGLVDPPQLSLKQQGLVPGIRLA